MMVSNGSIPILNFDAFYRSPHSAKIQLLIQRYRETLTTYGFGKLIHIGIQSRTIERAYREVRKFFGLPEKVKFSYCGVARPGIDPMGYVPPRTERAKSASRANLMEMFQFGNSSYVENNWPDRELPYFRKTMETLYREATDIAGPYLMSITERAYGYAHISLASLLTDGNTSIRLIRYAPLDDLNADNDEPLAEQHEDSNLKTILLPNEVDGPDTQIKLPGQGWISLGNEKGVFIINSGDMLKIFSMHDKEIPRFTQLERADLIRYLLENGTIPSTTHRVARPYDRTKASYRIAIFLHPRKDVVLAHGVTAGEFLKARMMENYSHI